MTAPRRCVDCGRIGQWPTRCPRCEAMRDAARGRRQARGYDAAHEAERREWALLIAAGVPVHCWRCALRILGAFDLGHRDGLTSHPEHPRCNRGAPHRNQPQEATR